MNNIKSYFNFPLKLPEFLKPFVTYLLVGTTKNQNENSYFNGELVGIKCIIATHYESFPKGVNLIPTTIVRLEEMALP